MTKDLLYHDWIVHYRFGDEEQELFAVFGQATMAGALTEASDRLEGDVEIIGILRRDMVGNADEMLGARHLN